MPGTSSILFVDAYDSFARNIIALLYNCLPSADIVIIQIDTDVPRLYGIEIHEFISRFDAIVLGPGPGDPRNQFDVGLFEYILDVSAESHIPLLGICLGFQSLCLRYGHGITRLPVPCHGQTKDIRSYGTDIFAGLRDGPDVRMMGYNSLGIQRSEFLLSDGDHSQSSTATPSSPGSGTSSPASTGPPLGNKTSALQLLAWDDDGFAMAVRHSMLPFWGLQFHPESCMCYDGAGLIKNWWAQIEPFTSARMSRVPPGVSACALDLRSQLIKKPSSGSPLSVEELNSRVSIGRVTWSMSKIKSVTPQHLSKYCHTLAGKGVCTMLESAAKGRYCIYAFSEANAEIIEYAQGQLTSRRGGVVYNLETMSLQEALNEVAARTKSRACNDGCPTIPFWGGWVGFCSYEAGLELINVRASDHQVVPDFSFVFVERSVVFDQHGRNICVQSIKNDDEAWVTNMMHKLKVLERTAGRDGMKHQSLREVLDSAKVSAPDHDDYTDKIRRCQEELHAGNSYELCLTSEARIDVPAPNANSSYDLYQNLIKHNPVPFAAYLHFPGTKPGSYQSGSTASGTTILSSSPEQFLSWSRDGTLDMIPMKGTVQRTPTTDIDEVYRILGSPKEAAENLMIADLIRHDLYGVVGCRPYPVVSEHERSIDQQPVAHTLPRQEDDSGPSIDNSTQKYERPAQDPLSIPALNTIKQFDTVYQLVSHIRAHPPPHVDASDPRSVIAHNHSSLHYVLPPGSMTGAPKKRSCEILQQLEQRNRGVYSGIIGYMDVGGGGCWSVAIRTAFSSEAEDYVVEKSAKGEVGDEDLVEVEKRKIWHVGAGGAVTVLSDVEGEWEEMMGKMNNVLKGFREVKEDMPAWRPE
ncbi:hypothetical protein OHC33_009590 [Knufia fluminis]|uniref:aminodeoxychorismate synthase n=1 Tax=Knufia fluminis TaxID=191047 RepID=A0AAN8IIT0_9EURO|nr:hypothetical protein OHC33_009590 [Knufia fluminis]